MLDLCGLNCSPVFSVLGQCFSIANSDDLDNIPRRAAFNLDPHYLQEYIYTFTDFEECIFKFMDFQ